MVTLKEYLKKRSEAQKRYYERNADRLKESRRLYFKNYYEKNKERLLAKRKNRYESDAEIIQRRNRKYIKAHKERVNKTSYKYYLSHKDELKRYNKEWHMKNKEHVKEYSRAYREKIRKRRDYTLEYSKNNSEKIKDKATVWNLINKYNLTKDEFDQMLVSQNNLCAICGQPETKVHNISGRVQRLSIDHDHKTSVVRELLCARCNLVLGNCDDNINILQSCIDYLKKHSQPSLPKGTVLNQINDNNMSRIEDNSIEITNQVEVVNVV